MNDFSAIIHQARSYTKSRKYKDAERVLLSGLKSFPNSSDIYFELANLFHHSGDVGRAIKSFKKTLELDPNHTEASIGLSVILNDIGKYKEARNIFEKADNRVKGGGTKNLIEDKHINKKFSIKHLELAELYLTYNRFDEALFEIKKACALDSDNEHLRVRLAKIYINKGFVAKAIDELTKLKNEKPNFLAARNALGLIYFSNGNVIEAQAEWKRVVSIDPKNKEAKNYLRLSENANEVSIP